MEIKVNALMLRAADYGENDKILTLLAAGRGKLTAGMKGVKKAGARLKFAAQPFCFAEYVLACRGGRYTVIGCSETESFYDLRTDIMKYCAACAAAEAALALTYEGDGADGIFYSLVNAFTQMCTGDERRALIAFLLFALDASGYGLSLEKCPFCGKPLSAAGDLRFDMPSGAFACAHCCDGPRAGAGTLNVLRRAAGLPFNEELASPEAEKRALRLFKEYFLYKTDNRFSALSEYIKLL